MNRTIISAIITALAITAGVTGIVIVDGQNYNSTYVYVPSDISKANPNIHSPTGNATMDTYNPSDVRHRITNTVIGTVLSVDDPVQFTDDRGYDHGFVPVTLQVHKNIKGQLDETVTFYLHGTYSMDKFSLMPYASQFELGEKVLVHLQPLTFVDFLEGDALHTALGKWSKYQIGDDNRAYNENHKQGRNLVFAENESR